MIQASPNLHSLELTILTRPSWNGAPWSDGSSSLSGVKVFNDLRIYRVCGTLDLDWRSFFEAPETNQFRLFIELHPHLHTVTIISANRIKGYEDFDPQTLAHLFPALRHFDGPGFLCEAFVQSTLAARLETLGIVGRGSRNSEMLSRIARKANVLPELRTLKFIIDDSSNFKDGLSAILATTPKLTHLFFACISTSLVCGLTFQNLGHKR